MKNLIQGGIPVGISFELLRDELKVTCGTPYNFTTRIDPENDTNEEIRNFIGFLIMRYFMQALHDPNGKHTKTLEINNFSITVGNTSVTGEPLRFSIEYVNERAWADRFKLYKNRFENLVERNGFITRKRIERELPAYHLRCTPA